MTLEQFFQARGEAKAAALAKEAAACHLVAAVEQDAPLLHWRLTPDCLHLLPSGRYWARLIGIFADGRTAAEDVHLEIA